MSLHAFLVPGDPGTTASEFRTLVERSPGLVSVIALDGKVLYASPAHEHALGYPPERLAGQAALALVHPDDRLAVGSRFATALGGDEAVHFGEFRFRHADGTYRVCEADGRALATHPAIAGVIVSTHDVTARSCFEASQRAETRVADALARVGRELMRTLAKPLLLDRLCSVAAETLRAMASAVLLGETASVLLPIASFGDTRRFARLVDGADPIGEKVRARLETEDASEVELPTEGDDLLEGTRWLCIALRRGAMLNGILVVGRPCDLPYSPAERRIAEGISQLASMCLENARLLEELERAHQVKSDFVATMSHELRTPLNIILGYLSLINEGDFGAVPEAMQEALGLVDRNAHALLELVQDTLDLSRLEREQLPLHRSELHLAELLTALDKETRRFHRKNAPVTVTWHVDEAAPRLVSDIGKLKIVLRNLLHNAFKFTDAGTIDVAARARDGGFELSVSDTGAGIPSGAFSRIFEPFTQLGDTSTRAHGGVGMGLYVARRLTELLGGTISVASRPGAGTTFTVWVPSIVNMKTTATQVPAASALGASHSLATGALQ